MVTGAILLGVIAVFKSDGANGVTLFENPGECISADEFRVIQVLGWGDALATAGRFVSGTTVLFLAEDGVYYDDQIIKIPHGKCAKQVGTFRYRTNADRSKTVPVVRILDE